MLQKGKTSGFFPFLVMSAQQAVVLSQNYTVVFQGLCGGI